MDIRIRFIEHEGKIPPLPHRATPGSAGVDLCAMISEPLTIAPRGLVRVPTGLALELPENTVGLVYARSGLGTKHGIALSNGVGVIDSDYRGEIAVGLCNLSDVPFTIQPGDRIAQLVVTPCPPVSFLPAEELSETARGAGGFGSSGR